jgi:ubiquinone/menaquinone biosynthesis C-methylase UbiE
MHTHRCVRPNDPTQVSSDHRARTLTGFLVASGGVTLILYSHGASWWYAPVAVAAVVLAHAAAFGGIVFVTARLTQRRRAPDGNAFGRETASSSHQGGSMVLHRPRLYDWMVRVQTLGREKKLRQWTLDLADLRSGSVVLDVGCGTGTLLLAAAERIGPSGTLHGVEPSAEMRAHARDKAKKREVSLEVVEGSADRLPYPDASIDAVFCTLALHHLPGPMREGAIREMRRVLRPGGRAVIVDWGRPTSVAKAIADPLSLVFFLHKFGPYTSPADVLDIEPLVTELGFEDIARHSYGSGALGAVVAHLSSGTRAIETPDTTPP